MMMALELVIAIIDDQLIALYHDKTMSLFPSVEQQQITYHLIQSNFNYFPFKYQKDNKSHLTCLSIWYIDFAFN
ncbi:hypothetical protein DERF_001662 [Dermatophagoides farinae]|uniref:Uncharacterized protein n=1 Tax=Dermatophagoides farinae TaxID=6954 RepID=A0A922ICP8_DERFA|nr:hypothetical protein DERF_001662 [Dermatophagoides farinae]